MQFNKYKSGFSLIEFVIVVTIIAILAAIAVPRLLLAVDEAKKVSVEQMASQFRIAINFVRGQWELEGRTKVNNVNATIYDGTRIYLTTQNISVGELGLSIGYPIDTKINSSTDIHPSNLTAERCLRIWDGLLQSPPNATTVYNEVLSRDTSLKYYITVSNNGLDSLCYYYLISSLSDGYHSSLSITEKAVYFTYQPASGLVRAFYK